MAGSPQTPDDQGLGFKVPGAIFNRLREMQQAVRDAGHHHPSDRVMVSALIHGATLDGERLEQDVLGPFRDAYPAESRE